jgi:tRNA 2-thiouridine synthesizing protein A
VGLLLDVRGLLCPVPLLRARAALPGVPPGEELVVLATDPEAPIDLGALALEEGCELRVGRREEALELVLRRRP